MRIFNFKSWLESAEFYDKEYRYDMDRFSGDNPKVFTHWFPQGQDRAYIPFQINGDDTNIKTQGIAVPFWRHHVEQILKQADFQLADFRKGLANPSNNPKRQQRIIPILQNISKQKPELAPQIATTIKDYEKFELRLNPGPNEFSIVISQDPHDIALMTYDRHWKMTSCMRLKDDKTEGGAKWHQVYDEVRDGGLIAYLIEPDDKDIKKPLARVLLRRFNNQNKDIALCEEVVYGLQIPGFKEAVKAWLDQHNPKAYGSFTRKGSEWSDTFALKHSVLAKQSELTRENQPYLQEMLDSLETHDFMPQAQAIIAAHKNFDQDFVTKVIQDLNKKFQDDSDEARRNISGRIITYHIPKIAMQLDVPINNIADILKAYNLNVIAANLSTHFAGGEELTNYMMPVLLEMVKKDNYSLDQFATHIQNNKVLQQDDFINAIPYSHAEEIVHYIDDPDTKYLFAKRFIKEMTKNIPGFVKKYERGDLSALDSITDEWIKPIVDILPKNKINDFFQIVKTLLPKELYQKLYGHTHR